MLSAALVLCLAQASPAALPVPGASPHPSPAGPVVVLDTTLGPIKIALDQAKAPITVANFVKYVRAGHYDGTIFHRVIPGFMIQGGGLTPALEERPQNAPIRNEARNGLRNLRGTIAMARTNDPDSATAQFFINLKDNAPLDFGIRGAGYAVFGEVVEGMDVVDRIAAVPTTSRGQYENVPVTPIVIKSAHVEGAARVAPKPPLARPSSHP